MMFPVQLETPKHLFQATFFGTKERGGYDASGSESGEG